MIDIYKFIKDYSIVFENKFKEQFYKFSYFMVFLQRIKEYQLKLFSIIFICLYWNNYYFSFFIIIINFLKDFLINYHYDLTYPNKEYFIIIITMWFWYSNLLNHMGDMNFFCPCYFFFNHKFRHLLIIIVILVKNVKLFKQIRIFYVIKQLTLNC